MRNWLRDLGVYFTVRNAIRKGKRVEVYNDGSESFRFVIIENR